MPRIFQAVQSPVPSAPVPEPGTGGKWGRSESLGYLAQGEDFVPAVAWRAPA